MSRHPIITAAAIVLASLLASLGPVLVVVHAATAAHKPAPAVMLAPAYQVVRMTGATADENIPACSAVRGELLWSADRGWWCEITFPDIVR